MAEEGTRLRTKGDLLLPSNSFESASLFIKRQSLRMAVVPRDGFTYLDEEWDAAGVYLLVGPAGEATHSVYAGKAPNGLATRLKQHASDSQKGWARLALLVAELNPHGFTSAEVGWLEGELVRTLKEAPAIECLNGPQPVDNTLPAYEQAALRPVIGTVTSVLRLIGVRPDTPDQIKVLPPKKQLTPVPGSTLDLLEAGLLKPGATVYCTWQNRAEFNEQAIVRSDGAFEIEGEVFDSPSAAAEYCRGGKANGWTFWGVPSSDGSLVKLADLRSNLKAAAAEPAEEDNG